MEARVVPEGSALAVYLTPVAGQTSLLPEAPAAATGPVPAPVIADAPAHIPAPARSPAVALAPSAPRHDDASVVTGLVVDGSRTKGSVTIVGDGSFRHNEFVLKNPDRLVVDLLGVTNKVPEKSYPVAADPLERVRVAQFKTQPEKVVRIVFDLTHPIEHKVVSDPDGIRVLHGRVPLGAQQLETREAALPPGERLPGEVARWHPGPCRQRRERRRAQRAGGPAGQVGVRVEGQPGISGQPRRQLPRPVGGIRRQFH